MGKDGQMGNVGNDWARLRAERMDTDGGGTVGAMRANTGKTGNVRANGKKRMPETVLPKC